MKSAPHPKTIWQNGILVRLFSAYLSNGLLAWSHALFVLFGAFVVIVELVCFLLYRRASHDPSRVDVYILSYLGAGGIVWFLAGIGFIIYSGAAPAWIYMAAFFIWLVSTIAQVYIATSLPVRRGASVGQAGGIAELRTRNAVGLKGIDFAVSMVSFAVLFCLGLGGIIVSYLGKYPSALEIFLGVLFIGLSAGFSANIRPAIIALRIQKARSKEGANAGSLAASKR